MRKVKYFISSCMLFALIIFASSATAQTTTSTIEGTVKDINGAVIAGAQVKAREQLLPLNEPLLPMRKDSTGSSHCRQENIH